MKYIQSKNEEELFYASFGSFMHRLLEKFYTGKSTPEELECEFLQSFSESVKGERPSNVDVYVDKGRNYLRNLQPLPYKIIGVEQYMTLTISGKQFVGVIDLLAEDSDGFIIIDHKSHKLKPPSGRERKTKSDEELEAYARQLYLYCEAVKQKYGSYPHHICFNCFLNGHFISLPFHAEQFKAAKEWALSEIRCIEDTDDFYPRNDWFFCKNLCGYHNDCIYFEEWRKGGG